MAQEQALARKSDDQLTAKEASEGIERIVAECGIVALKDQPPLMQAISLARGVSGMRKLLHEDAVKRFFLPLQGTPLGFVTDLDSKGGYTWDVVRDVVIEAMLRGFRPIGNEFNIIAGRFYGARAGFERIVREFPNVSALEYDLGVPDVKGDKGALVAFEARWKYHGAPMALRGAPPSKDGEFDTRIPVRINGGMGTDAVLGKATRKMFARIYQRLTGCAADIVEAEPGDGPAIVDALPAPAAAAQDGRRISMRKRGAPESSPTASTIPHDPETGEVFDREPGMEG